MMEELVQRVAAKTGLSEEMSRAAVEVVVNYLQERLPEPVASQVSKFVHQGRTGVDLDDLAGGLSNLLGGKN